MSLDPNPPVTVSRSSGVQFAIALLALAVAVFFAAQIGAAGQQSKMTGWQMTNGDKQIANAKTNEEQYGKLIEQQAVTVKQVEELQAQYQKLLDELLVLSDTDQDAKAIVDHFKIQRNKPAGADTKPADKPAEK